MVIRAIFGFLKKTNSDENKQVKKFDDEYKKKMIKQKKEYLEFRKKEGDSDLFFNDKDNNTQDK
jgi:hypothetical protein